MVALIQPRLPDSVIKNANYRPEVADHVQQAIEKFARQDYEAALTEWNQAVALSPKEPAIRLGRGLLLVNLTRFEQATSDLDIAESLDLSSDLAGDLHVALAVALHGLGKPKEALAELDRSLSLGYDPSVFAELRREMVAESLKALVKSGFASWSGKRPKGSKNPVRISPGPPVSDYVIQDRR